jgi:hypothetical protein
MCEWGIEENQNWQSAVYQPGIKQGTLEYKETVLWHVHPLLGADGEISSYTIAGVK